MNAFFGFLAAFLALHVGVAGGPWRAPIVKAMGAARYRLLFSLLSLGLLAGLVLTYPIAAASPADRRLYDLGPWGRMIGIVLVNLGFMFVIGGYLAPNPTSLLYRAKAGVMIEPRGFQRITRHPVLWGVVFWSLGHLAATGNSAAVALFGGLAAMCLYGTRSIDRRLARRAAHIESAGAEGSVTGPASLRAVTSNLPFAAIIAGRNHLRPVEILWRAAIGLSLCFVAAYFHTPRIFPAG